MVTETEKILFRSGIREDRFCLTGFMHVWCASASSGLDRFILKGTDMSLDLG
jgi:hypothetical protein